jgi:hypothetical protein
MGMCEYRCNHEKLKLKAFEMSIGNPIQVAIGRQGMEVEA